MAMAGDSASEPPVTTTAAPATPTFDLPSSSNASKKKLTPRKKQ